MVKSVAKVEYVEQCQVYTSHYLKNSKAVGILWGVFTFCFAIIDVVIFIQPQWIGDTDSVKGGHFGLWKYCRSFQGSHEIVCKGQLEDFSSILNPAFRSATTFVGLSVLAILICLCVMFFFFFFSSSTVFHVCGWLQLFSGFFLIIGVLSFPAGWNDPNVQEVCGIATKSFYLDNCRLRWAYILAIIGVCDIIILASLAFTLAVRHIKLLSMQPHPAIFKGEINQGYITDDRRRPSANHVPQSVIMIPQPGGPQNDVHDRMSEYSHRTNRSKPSSMVYYPDYAAAGGAAGGRHYQL